MVTSPDASTLVTYETKMAACKELDPDKLTKKEGTVNVYILRRKLTFFSSLLGLEGIINYCF